MPIDWLITWGVSQAAGALVKPVLEDFAKDVINDSAKDYVKRCFGNIFSAAHQDALQKALGKALAELLKLIEAEILDADYDPHAWKNDAKQFVRSDAVADALRELFTTSATQVSASLLQAGWASSPDTDPLPAEFDWARVAKRFSRAVLSLREQDAELREILNSQALRETADATKRRAHLPPEFNLDGYRESLLNAEHSATESSGVGEVEAFLPEIEEAYSETLTWLDSLPSPLDYRKKTIEDKIENLLKKPTLLSAAAQFYVRFPGHFFKVSHTLNNIAGNLLVNKPAKICLIDVGCGAGAASAAFINHYLKLRKAVRVTEPIDIYCIGVDINPWATPLYDQMMTRISSKVDVPGFTLSHCQIPDGNLEALVVLREKLEEKRKIIWQQPFLTDVIIMQVNVALPFSNKVEAVNSLAREFETAGIDSKVLGDHQRAFGLPEAIAYKQLLEDVAIERLHVFTIATKGYEKPVQEMADVLQKTFNSQKHKTESTGCRECRVTFKLPLTSYWAEKRQSYTYDENYHVDVTSIKSLNLEDREWESVISHDNLQLAWARARNYLLNESLIDEVEIRLFEASLDQGLEKLRQQLLCYAFDLIQSDDRLAYKFPKSMIATRPRSLSRIEEEILATAIIQKLGHTISNLSGSSYAYKFPQNQQSSETEFLYEPYFDAYTRFIREARDAAHKYEKGIVIRLDIKDFYTRIIQDQLIETVSDNLTSSKRIEWLMRLLLLRDIDEHEAGLGLVQGSLGSGFFANLYLLNLDSKFPNHNDWGARFYRYVDDMIVVLPTRKNRKAVLEVVNAEIQARGLELNQKKTEVLSTAQFLENEAPEIELDELHKLFLNVLLPLWALNKETRKAFKFHYYSSNDQWWDAISTYKKCLESLGVFFSEVVISRRISPLLLNDWRRQGRLKDEPELIFPTIPFGEIDLNIEEWRAKFHSQNGEWVNKLTTLRSKLERMFQVSNESLQKAPLHKSQERRCLRKLRYSANRLAEIGYNKSLAAQIATLLQANPSVFPDAYALIESLARQQFVKLIDSLLKDRSTSNDEAGAYIRAMTIRAVRALNSLDYKILEEVASAAISAKLIESLMATETWLALGERPRNLVTQLHLDQIESAFYSVTSSRLRKNYLLILARHGCVPKINLDENDESLLAKVLESISDGKNESLFDNKEPEILRRRYYKDIQQDGGGDLQYF